MYITKEQLLTLINLYVLEEIKENIPYTDYCNIRFILKGLSPELNFYLN